MSETVVLEVMWHEGVDLPAWIGPFSSEDEARRWGDLNVPNGLWQTHHLARPYAEVER